MITLRWIAGLSFSPPALQTRVKKLFQIPLDPETAKTFTANLGLSASDFRTPPTSFQAICQRWLSQGSAPGDLDQLVEALVSTRGLGRHTSYLCSPGKLCYVFFFATLNCFFQKVIMNGPIWKPSRNAVVDAHYSTTTSSIEMQKESIAVEIPHAKSLKISPL